MKKKVFLCIAVSLVLFAASASAAKQSTLIDFFRGGGKTAESNNNGTSDDVSTNNSSSIREEGKELDVIPLESDNVSDTPMIVEHSLEPIQPPLKIEEENRIDEVFVNSFRGVTSIADLLKNIESNVESLTFGRMSNDDYNKLLQKKQKILKYKNQYDQSVLAYDKICAMEKIFMNYNAVSEISVHFLSDINGKDINNVQEALFVDEIGVMGDSLTYTFKTPISNNLKGSIEAIQKKPNSYKLEEFTQKLLKELDKIPRELLDSEQYMKLENITKELHTPVSGDFKTKCHILHHFVESYDELKSIPFRLKKISSESTKNLALKAIEDMFFEKMLNTLRIMDGARFSTKSENDAEVVAALNIKKCICTLLGGISYSGKEYKSNIEQFRTTKSISEKKELLKKSISKFNRAVDKFKIAVSSLREEGKYQTIKDEDMVCGINEDIDKIFEKIALYDKNTKKEDSKDFQDIVIERSDKDTLNDLRDLNKDKPVNKEELVAKEDPNVKVNPVSNNDTKVEPKAEIKTEENVDPKAEPDVFVEELFDLAE